MKNETIYYFGTNLRDAGHYFHKLDGTRMEYMNINYKGLPFSVEVLTDNIKHKGNGSSIFYQVNEEYSIFAIVGSCTDTRPGCKTVFFLREIVSRSEMIERIKNTPIAMTIINKCPFDIDL